MKSYLKYIYFFILVLLLLFIIKPMVFRIAYERMNPFKTQNSILTATKQYEASADEFWLPKFKEINRNYPPQKIAIIVFKDSKQLEVYDVSEEQKLKINSFNILAASGKLGPKLKEGDRQVPEGLYKIDLFNPNSSYHLSMRINYPNQFDQDIAIQEDRDNLGGDIYIHGENVSIGCIAIGNEAIEKLFILAAKTKESPIEVIISPTDFRLKKSELLNTQKEQWIKDLYTAIYKKLELFKD